MVQLLKAEIKFAFILPESRSSNKVALSSSSSPPKKGSPLVTELECDKNSVSQHTSIVMLAKPMALG